MSAIHFLKRLYTEVASRTKEGRPYKVKYKVIDENTISLTGPDLSIKGIAAQLHFDDPSYMCRFFKRQTGSSPAQFRKGDD